MLAPNEHNIDIQDTSTVINKTTLNYTAKIRTINEVRRNSLLHEYLYRTPQQDHIVD